MKTIKLSLLAVLKSIHQEGNLPQNENCHYQIGLPKFNLSNLDINQNVNGAIFNAKVSNINNIIDLKSFDRNKYKSADHLGLSDYNME